MLDVKIGFVPTYRGDWGHMDDWCRRMRADAVRVLNQVPGIQLVVPAAGGAQADLALGLTPDGGVANLSQGEAVADYFLRENVDGIIIGALNFGDERSASKIAERLRVPVLLYATKEPPALETASMARVSDSYCGTLSIASGLYRRKIPFHFAGILLADEPEFLEEVQAFIRSVSVVKSLNGAHIGQIGLRPTSFETVAYNEVAMMNKFGQNVVFQDLSELVTRAKSYSTDDPGIQELVENTRKSVAQVTVADDWLDKAARLEMAVASFWMDNRLSALAMSCWPAIQRIYGLSVCALFGNLTGKGMLTACETDILGALSMLVSYSASLGETIPHFIDWTIQHRDDPNRFLAWHCGNAPTCLADNPAKTALRARTDMAGSLTVREGDEMAGLYQFQLRPGPVTFSRLAEYDGEWKMLIAPGEIIPSDEVLAGTWAWVELPDHQKLYRTLVEEGFIHHASMAHGNQVEALTRACKYLDIKPVVVC